METILSYVIEVSKYSVTPGVDPIRSLLSLVEVVRPLHPGLRTWYHTAMTEEDSLSTVFFQDAAVCDANVDISEVYGDLVASVWNGGAAEDASAAIMVSCGNSSGRPPSCSLELGAQLLRDIERDGVIKDLLQRIAAAQESEVCSIRPTSAHGPWVLEDAPQAGYFTLLHDSLVQSNWENCPCSHSRRADYAFIDLASDLSAPITEDLRLTWASLNEWLAASCRFPSRMDRLQALRSS